MKFRNELPIFVASNSGFANIVSHSTKINSSLKSKAFKENSQLGQLYANTKLISSKPSIYNVQPSSWCRSRLYSAPETSIGTPVYLSEFANPTSTAALDQIHDLDFLEKLLASSAAFLALSEVLLMYLNFPIKSSNFHFNVYNSASCFLNLCSRCPAGFRSPA